MVINRVGPVSFARIVGTLYAFMGLVLGACISLIATIGGGFGSQNFGFPGFGAFLGIGAIIAAPIFYGLLGFVSALIGAALYNVLASAVGGIELDLR